MAATVDTVAAGLVDALKTIDGFRAWADIPDNITPPCAVVILDSVPTYHGAEQGGLCTYEFRVQTIVDNLSNRTAFTRLNKFLSYSGNDSIRAAIETDTTLGSVCQTLRVDRAENIGELSAGEVRYLAADVLVTVYA